MITISFYFLFKYLLDSQIVVAIVLCWMLFSLLLLLNPHFWKAQGHQENLQVFWKYKGNGGSKSTANCLGHFYLILIFVSNSLALWIVLHFNPTYTIVVKVIHFFLLKLFILKTKKGMSLVYLHTNFCA